MINDIYIIVDHVIKKRDQSRANKEHGDRIINDGVLIGGTFINNDNGITYQNNRIQVFNRLWEKNIQEILKYDNIKIIISLPDGNIKDGIAFKTSPYDIALSISKGLAESIVIAKVTYKTRYDTNDIIIACDEDEESSENKSSSSTTTNNDELKSELWDLNRPLIGDCTLQLLKFDDPEAKTVFWHSSAHVLGMMMRRRIFMMMMMINSVILLLIGYRWYMMH